LDYAPTDPLLNAKQSAEETGQSLPGFWKGVAAGRFPEPFYPAPRAPRWRLSELHGALEMTRSKPSKQKIKRTLNRMAPLTSAA
jgi:predicted DNA-binding transcriptional regulator AlpA